MELPRKGSERTVVLLALVSLLAIGGILRLFDLGLRGYFVPDEELSIKTGNYYTLGNATGYGLKFSPNGSLVSLWPHAYNYEHPPLGKILIGYSGVLFWHTAVGYRMLGAILSTALIPIVFFLARRFMNDFWALVPAAIAAIDPVLVQLGRIATPDVYFLFFAAAAIAAASILRGWRSVVATGLLMGLSVASKWLGIYALLAVLIYQILSGKNAVRRVSTPLVTLLIAAGVYGVSYYEYFIGGPVYQIGPPGSAPSYLLLGPHSLADFVQLQLWMVDFTSYWHVIGAPYGYLFSSNLTYVLPGVSSAPVYAFDIVLLLGVPMAALAYVFRMKPPLMLVLWALVGLIPLLNKGFVWYLAFEIPGAAMVMTWFASKLRAETRMVWAIPALLVFAEAYTYLLYVPT